MKKIIIALVIFLFQPPASIALADVFQFKSAENKTQAAFATIQQNGQTIGYTDNRGFIVINHPKGENTFTVLFKGRASKIRLNVSGSNYIKTVTID